MKRILVTLISLSLAAAEQSLAVSGLEHLGTPVATMTVTWKGGQLLGQPVVAAQVAWTLPPTMTEPFWRDQVEIQLAVNVAGHRGWLPLKTVLPTADGVAGKKLTRSARWTTLILSEDPQLDEALVRQHWPDGIIADGIRLIGGEALDAQRAAVAQQAQIQLNAADEVLARTEADFNQQLAQAEAVQQEREERIRAEERQRAAALQRAQDQRSQTNAEQTAMHSQNAQQHAQQMLADQDRESRSEMHRYRERQQDAKLDHEDALDDHRATIAQKNDWEAWEENHRRQWQEFADDMAETNRQTQAIIEDHQRQQAAERAAVAERNREAIAAQQQQQQERQRQQTEALKRQQEENQRRQAEQERQQREAAAEQERIAREAEATRQRLAKEAEQRRLQQVAAERKALVERTKRVAIGPGQSNVADYPSQAAANKKDATCTVRDIVLAGEPVASMSFRLRHSVFMGEPIESYIMHWTSSSGAEKAAWGRVRCTLAITSGNETVYVTCSPLVPKAGEWSWDVNGSPNWNDYYQDASGAGIGKERAKAIYIAGGSVRIVEISVD